MTTGNPPAITLSLMSDLHLDVAPFSPGVIEADIHILAGDIGEVNKVNPVHWALAHFPDPTQPVLLVPGNHDFYGGRMPDTLKNLRADARGSHVRVLYNDPFDFHGVRFLGTPLWSDLASYGETEKGRLLKISAQHISDFSCIFNDQGKNWSVDDMLRENKIALKFLRNALAKDLAIPKVVLTHWAPHLGSTHPDFADHPFNPFFINHFPDLVQAATVWFHGHTHQPADYQVGDVPGRGQVLCNPRGYVKPMRPGETYASSPHSGAPYAPLRLTLDLTTGQIQREL